MGSSDEKDEIQQVEQVENVSALAQGTADPLTTGLQFDRGITAWLQVLGSFLLWLNTWGIVNAYGIFQTFYFEGTAGWVADASKISWIGSIQAFLLLAMGLVAGILYDSGYFRALVVAGTLLVALGLAMTSLCSQYWQTMLAQGVTVGIGVACLYLPSVALLPQYFSRRLALATGIAASGSGVGGVIYPIMLRQLEHTLGLAWAVRAMALVALVTCGAACCIMKPRFQPHPLDVWVEWRAFRDPAYSLFTASVFFGFMGFFVPFYYIETYALVQGLAPPTQAFYLLPITCASSIPGVLLPNFLSDHLGPLNVLVFASTVTTILALVWIAIETSVGLILFAVFYGVASGVYVSLPSVAVVALTNDLGRIGVCMGQTFFIAAFGLLVGAPVSGQLYADTGDFFSLQMFAGISLLVATLLGLAARVARTGLVLRLKI